MLEVFKGIFQIVEYIVSLMGWPGIAVGMMLESACIPLPSELILPLGGFMAAAGKVSLNCVNFAAALGSICGSLAAYAIGYYGGRPFILKYGKYFFVSDKNFIKAEFFFKKHGGVTVFLGRLLPVIRTFISLPAGISRMTLGKFILYSFAGMLPWNFILIFLGLKFGENFETVVGPIFHKYEYAVVILVFAAILILLTIRVIKLKRER